MKRKFLLIISLITVAMMIAGCGKSEKTADDGGKAAKEEGYIKVVAEVKKELVNLDEDMYTYKTTLDNVGKYLAGEQKREEIMNEVKSVTEALESTKNNISETVLAEDVRKLFTEYDILVEDYEGFVKSRSAIIEGYIGDLDLLYSYLETEEEIEGQREGLEFMHKEYLAIYELSQKYNMYALNHWFTEWDDEKVQAVKDMVGELKTYEIDDYEWKKDKTAIESDAELCLDEMEEHVNAMAEYIAGKEEELLEMQQNADK